MAKFTAVIAEQILHSKHKCPLNIQPKGNENRILKYSG